MDAILIQRYLKATGKNSADTVTFADLIALTDDSEGNSRVQEAIGEVAASEPVEVTA